MTQTNVTVPAQLLERHCTSNLCEEGRADAGIRAGTAGGSFPEGEVHGVLTV